jgi:hypothetical protein
MDFHNLIERCIEDIQFLESKVVYLRYALSQYLQNHEGDMLRCEIFSGLAGTYYDQPAYQRFVSTHCGGTDPMECNSYIEFLSKLSKGIAAVDY